MNKQRSPNFSRKKKSNQHSLGRHADIDQVVPYLQSEASLRVMLVTNGLPPDQGGQNRRAYQYAKRLNSQGKLSAVAIYRPLHGQEISGSVKLWEVPVFTVHSLAQETQKTTGYFLGHCKLFLDLTKLLVRKRKDYNVVHCYSTGWICRYALAIAKLLGKKTIIEMVLLGADDPISLFKSSSWLKKAIREWPFKLADKIVGLSPALLASCSAVGIPASKLELIPTFIGSNLFCPPLKGERELLRRKLNLPTAGSLILFVGIICKRKGVDHLLCVFERLVQCDQEVSLVIVGSMLKDDRDYSFLEFFKKIVQQPNLKNRIFFSGEVENVHDYMKAADVMVFPTLAEGLPAVIMEAMACGLPVVTNLIPGVTDFVIKSGYNGFLIPDFSIAVYVEVILRLLRDQGLHDEIAKNGWLTTEAQFIAPIVDKQYEKLYRKLLRTH